MYTSPIFIVVISHTSQLTRPNQVIQHTFSVTHLFMPLFLSPLKTFTFPLLLSAQHQLSRCILNHLLNLEVFPDLLAKLDSVSSSIKPLSTLLWSLTDFALYHSYFFNLNYLYRKLSPTAMSTCLKYYTFSVSISLYDELR